MTKELNKINIKEKTYFATPAPEFFSCQGCSFLHNRIECNKVKQQHGCYSNDRTTRLIWVEKTQHEKQNTQNEHDPVNHPSHYTRHPSGIECIQVTEHMTFNCGNAVKYIWRNGLKDGQPDIQDLQKAIWYLNREIERLGENHE